MSVSDRRNRWQNIQKGLQFIQSTLPFPGSQDQYEVFIKDLVLNLSSEGVDVFSEGEWSRSMEMFTEALSVAQYAQSEDVSVSASLMEKLYANRAAACLRVALFDQALEDADKALVLNAANHRALYRKARALKELGRHQDAYEAVAKCSLAAPQDANVTQLTQELATLLGLKIRRAYVRSQPGLRRSSPCEKLCSVDELETEGAEPQAAEELRLDDGSPLPPFVNGRCSKPRPLPDADIIGNDLDSLLDIPTANGPLPLPAGPPFLLAAPPLCTVTLPPLYSQLGFGMDAFDSLAPPLDSLDSLSLADYEPDFIPSTAFMPQAGGDAPMGMAVGMPEVRAGLKNPLTETHDFKQACSQCYVRTGPGVLDYSLLSEEHKCKKDVLLGRLRQNAAWKLIRPRPTKTQYVGPYYICKEVAVGKDCLYPGHCTFAYCQEEIDVWTLERKGFISRETLFDPCTPATNITLPKILQEHQGTFTFLCGVCFDHKPRIISKTNKDDAAICSHPVTKHNFEENKCLVHILKEKTVRYSKVRPLSALMQLDLCRHEVRYGCVREDECFYAHSLIELKVWMMQRDLGISHEAIVMETRKFWNAAVSSQGAQLSIIQRRFGPPNLKMLFVCGQCWRHGQLSEADRNKKYCSAKARHTWAKDRRVVLISSNERRKWTTARPLPTKKPVPAQFEICLHVQMGKKCQYVGNCTFAHSGEERELWSFMKENNIPDMEQLYERWLQAQRPGDDGAAGSMRENGKQIHMPTDYAEEVAGNHCWLCGKNCNSEKQWQQHITSEKHKDRVFNSEDDQNCWQYRFPTGTFRVCERFMKGTCTEDEQCRLAHGEQELREWMERREFLLMKLAKARKDHLIAPNDNDFGKYSFLLRDIKA